MDRFEFLGSEFKVTSQRHGYHGYLDLLLRDKSNQEIVVADLKVKDSSTFVPISHTWQVAAYAKAIEEMTQAGEMTYPKVHRGMLLLLHGEQGGTGIVGDGTDAVISECTVSDLDLAFEDFLASLRLFNLKPRDEAIYQV